jgi:hypothetical protein
MDATQNTPSLIATAAVDTLDKAAAAYGDKRQRCLTIRQIARRLRLRPTEIRAGLEYAIDHGMIAAYTVDHSGSHPHVEYADVARVRLDPYSLHYSTDAGSLARAAQDLTAATADARAYAYARRIDADPAAGWEGNIPEDVLDRMLGYGWLYRDMDAPEYWRLTYAGEAAAAD